MRVYGTLSCCGLRSNPPCMLGIFLGGFYLCGVSAIEDISECSVCILRRAFSVRMSAHLITCSLGHNMFVVIRVVIRSLCVLTLCSLIYPVALFIGFSLVIESRSFFSLEWKLDVLDSINFVLRCLTSETCR